MRSSSTPAFDLKGAVDGLREAFAPRAEGMWRSSDVRSGILIVLHAGAKNGHEIMQAIGRLPGSRTPSAGSVYPLLQQLTDEGLVTSEQHDERKVYSLTESGRVAADEATAEHAARGEHRWGPRMPTFGAPWNEQSWGEHTAVPKAGAKLAQAAAVVAQSGTVEQQERAAQILDEARKRLYAILAED